MLTGFIEQTSGEIVVDGFDMLKKPKLKKTKRPPTKKKKN